ncbi:MAG TPA: DUF3450 family protein [Xanthomonadales bacterium]|nr:DUF3450 family protein [Xanthomonadales bacterium]
MKIIFKNRFMTTILLSGTAVLWPALSWGQTGDQADTGNLASRLVQMRGQVDELQTELSLARDEHRNRMAFLTAQLTELEANRDREALRLQQLENELEKMRIDVAAAGDSGSVLEPVLIEQLLKLKSQVSNGFPFKRGERLAELDEIESQLSAGTLPAQRAFNRLWAFVEDEMRISRENAIYSQSIELDGNSVLVDIAKLGNAMMYFRTRDLKYGRALQSPQGWRFELLSDPSDQERTARLFDALRKQIRQGYFELPNALPPSSGLGMEASS